MKMRGLVLEIGDANDYARGKLNGKQLEAHCWQPYRWEPAAPAPPAAGRGRTAAPPTGSLGPLRLVAR